MVDFLKYKKIYAVGHEENKDMFLDVNDELVVTEKIDGGNFRFYIKEGVIYFGSRSQDLDLTAEHTKNFWRCAEFVKQQIYGRCDLDKLEGRIYYGECCIAHSMQYDWTKIPPFLGFDIYCMEHQKFLRNYDMLFAAMNLPVVPVVMVCKVSELPKIDDSLVPESKYAPPSAQDKLAEGVVIKNYSKQIFSKFVRDKFKEINAEAFGATSIKYNKEDDTDNAEFIFKYCTNARIDKIIFKLIDEGNKLDMPMMALLPKRVYADIWEENWKEISDKRWKLDFKSLKQKIPHRCKAVLQQVMVNSAIGGKQDEKKE